MHNQNDLYTDAGELTHRCLDELLNEECSFEEETAEIQSDYLHTYPYKDFAVSLTEILQKHGFTGDLNSVNEKAAYILTQCEKKGIQINRQTIQNWFTDSRPSSNSRSREIMYRLCFALEFTITETINFFRIVYFECPFNFRDHHEVVYYYCFCNHLQYTDAIRLIEETDHILSTHNAEEPALEYTNMIGFELDSIHSDDELLNYIEKNRREFFRNNRTAFHYASRLIDEATDLALKMYQLETTEHEARALNRKNNIDLLLFQMLGVDLVQYTGEQSFAKAAKLPAIVKSSFPLKMQLSNIKNGKTVSYEALRKALILLNFYRYFAMLFYENRKDKMFCSLEEDFLTFVYETDDLLKTCGYPKLYIRNPYDWLIMHCAFHEYPLNEFRDAISRYYTDIIEDAF